MKIEALGKPRGCKLLRITAEFSEPWGEDSLLESISIRGDFFAIPEEGFEAVEKRLKGRKLVGLDEAFDSLLEELGLRVMGISGEGILAILRGAIHEASVQDTADRPR